MYVTPITNLTDARLQSNKIAKVNCRLNLDNNQSDAISFSGKTLPANVFVNKVGSFTKEQLKLLLSFNMWEPNVMVKMPESQVEKEIWLELLDKRKIIDKFVKLNNRGYSGMTEAEKKAHKLKLTEQEKRYGSIIDYFRQLDEKRESDIKPHTLEKYWLRLKKENINKDGKFSVDDLIEIISGKKEINPIEKLEAEKPAMHTSKLLSQNEVLLSVEKDYEKYLRENINLYLGNFEDAIKGCKEIVKTYKSDIVRYPKINKKIVGIFERMRRKYNLKVERLGRVDIYDIGEAWRKMNENVADMKVTSQEILSLKNQFAKQKNDKNLQAQLIAAEEKLAKAKKQWTEDMLDSVECEAKNREIFREKGAFSEYDFLTGINKDLLRYQELSRISKENKGVLPEDIWTEILA